MLTAAPPVSPVDRPEGRSLPMEPAGKLIDLWRKSRDPCSNSDASHGQSKGLNRPTHLFVFHWGGCSNRILFAS